ncbi:hypothetical protein [Yoonia sp. BS5-3]|uniref:Oxetanocin A resistance protein n=1 Tax=Yoonia phaeophyticola TaxID=3137369 RepID=A0ABZ2UZV6_9RHOB
MGTLPVLTDDCSQCAGLCCIAYPFDDPDYFATSKAADTACKNLGSCFECTIHDDLNAKGFPGCVSYSCAGAGQRVIQEFFEGETWQDYPALRPEMTHGLRVLRPIHEALMLLDQAQGLPVPQALLDEGKMLMQALCPDDPTGICDFETLEVQGALAQVPTYLRGLGTYLDI